MQSQNCKDYSKFFSLFQADEGQPGLQIPKLLGSNQDSVQEDELHMKK
jgi:hypothetical protein